MKQYGIDNIRGGNYVMDNFSDYQRSVLQKDIWKSQGRCEYCGEHCNICNNVKGIQTIYEDLNEDTITCKHCKREFDTDIEQIYHTCRPTIFDIKRVPL